LSYTYKKTPKSKTKDSQKEPVKKTKEQTHPLMKLSETIGNQAMQRLVKNKILQKKNTPNKTGLPDKIKVGVENISGISLDDVKVHYNSSKPSKVNALAYTQGTDIHVGTGQEKHLAHEAWHVVQQAQRRVDPTMQIKGNVNINDDVNLEKEADVMGVKAIQMKGKETVSKTTNLGWGVVDPSQESVARVLGQVVQLKALSSAKLNVAGENHPESGKRRESEKKYAESKKSLPYMRESGFKYIATIPWFFGKRTKKVETKGDPHLLRAEHHLNQLEEKHAKIFLSEFAKGKIPESLPQNVDIKIMWETCIDILSDSTKQVRWEIIKALDTPSEKVNSSKLTDTFEELEQLDKKLLEMKSLSEKPTIAAAAKTISNSIKKIRLGFSKSLGMANRTQKDIMNARSKAMMKAAKDSGKKGLWKVGDKHIDDIKEMNVPLNTNAYQIMSKDEFNKDYGLWPGIELEEIEEQ